MSKHRKVQILTYTKTVKENPRVDAEVHLLKKLGIEVKCIDASNWLLSNIYTVIERLPLIYQLRIFLDWVLISFFSKNVSSNRLCISHDYYAALFCHWKNIPYIHNMEEYYPGEYDDDSFMSQAVARYKKKIIKVISKSCKHFIVESYPVKKELQKYDIKESNITILPNKPLPIKAKKVNIEVDKEFINLVYFGYITKKRNIDSYIELLDYREDVNLTLIGPGNPRYLRTLKNKSKKNKRLHIIESMDLKSLFGTIQKYDLSLIYFLSKQPHHRYFTTPNKFWQSLYSGLPVIVSNASAMSQFVISNSVGISINEKDPSWINGLDKKNIIHYRNNILSIKQSTLTIISELEKINNMIHQYEEFMYD